MPLALRTALWQVRRLIDDCAHAVENRGPSRRQPRPHVPPVTIDIVSDVVCPWCYIGKHRLDQAIAALDSETRFTTRWLPYELNPDIPKDGLSRADYCELKFGTQERAATLYRNIAAAAAEAGLPFEPQRIDRMPNTRAAHGLLDVALAAGCQQALMDRLFEAYFVAGQDVGDRATLLQLAVAAGLTHDTASKALDDEALQARITQQVADTQDSGIHGVPAFHYNGRFIFSGAQSVETIRLVLERAIRKGL